MEPNEVRKQIEKILLSESFKDKRSAEEAAFRSPFQESNTNDSQTRSRHQGTLARGDLGKKAPADVATEINRLRKALKCYYDDEGKNAPPSA